MDIIKHGPFWLSILHLMWTSSNTMDVNGNTVPVRQLRKPPSQRNRNSQTATQPETQNAAAAGTAPTANLDPYGWAAIWLLVGYQCYGNSQHFYIWAAITAVLILATKAQYFIGAAALLGFLYYAFQALLT